MLQSLKKIFRMDSDIWASIVLGHNWVKIAYLPQKGFFGKFHLNDFYLLIVPYAANFEKKSLEQILR